MSDQVPTDDHVNDAQALVIADLAASEPWRFQVAVNNFELYNCAHGCSSTMQTLYAGTDRKRMISNKGNNIHALCS